MAHSFTFKSKLKIFGISARLSFAMLEAGNYSGQLDFLEEGVSMDKIIYQFWQKVGGGKQFPFPRFKTRLKSIEVQIIEQAEDSIFLIQTVVNSIEVSIFFTKKKTEAATQIISLRSVAPIVIDSLPGVSTKLNDPIVANFTFNLCSKTTTVNYGNGFEKTYSKGFSYDLDLKLPETEPSTFTFTIPEKSAAYAFDTPEIKEKNANTGFEIPSVFWFDWNEKIGPATFYKIGLTLKDGKLWVLWNVDFSFSRLTLALMGLRMGSDVNEWGNNIELGLDGIGVAYDSPFFGITGLLIQDKTSDNFVGSITLRSRFLSIFGAGAYGKIDGNNSVFVYALVDYPLGGVPFFFVEGLALGFGYNRAVNVPPVERLSEFPLVQQALGTSPAIHKGELLQSLAHNLAEAFPLSQDNLFLAVGVKFTSFKLLDAFLLLVVGFGERLKFNLVGIGSLSLPPMFEKPQVYIEVVMQTAFLPEEGAIKIRGNISKNSYILSDNARLSGGFAFYAWFKDHEKLGTRAGDFVINLGGYHPLFKKPTHYPDVPRVDLTWYVTENLYLKGQSYFALTPAAVMLGGQFKAVWSSDNFKAAFDFEMNLLTQWKPFFYDFKTRINAQIEFKAKILRTHKTITMDVGANLDIWGPEFSGKAQVTVKTFGINFNFGLEFGSKKEVERTLDWAAFKTGFLPKDNQVLSVNIVDGLTTKEGETLTVNPKDLTLRIESVIPATGLDLDETEKGASFGIYPMSLSALTSEISVTLSDEIAPFELVEFVYKNVPAALWSNRETVELNTPSMVTDTLSGFVIRAEAPQFDNEIPLDAATLITEANVKKGAWNWSSFKNTKNDVFDFDGITKGYEGSFYKMTPSDEELKRLRNKVAVVEI